MDPDQMAAVLAAGGALLAALGLRDRKDALNGGRGTTLGLGMARAGAKSARFAGDATAATGRMAVDTAASGVRVGGAMAAHAAGFVLDGAGVVSRNAIHVGRSLVRRPVPPHIGVLPAQSDHAELTA